ncbi:hypothetical protein DAERI_130071 [Deinococcus aerius]|uniref:Uncharacterized protein n=1 Tax=Deinococcus aerius TaxID=200253 RepID=A0A2I9DPW1_9DEIO|nr:hypothetical protein [Deinococcus aerius]GBF07241.1 hypothetical protein DAERI_130071 [Deinococcus aerius]
MNWNLRLLTPFLLAGGVLLLTQPFGGSGGTPAAKETVTPVGLLRAGLSPTDTKKPNQECSSETGCVDVTVSRPFITAPSISDVEGVLDLGEGGVHPLTPNDGAVTAQGLNPYSGTTTINCDKKCPEEVSGNLLLYAQGLNVYSEPFSTKVPAPLEVLGVTPSASKPDLVNTIYWAAIGAGILSFLLLLATRPAVYILGRKDRGDTEPAALADEVISQKKWAFPGELSTIFAAATGLVSVAAVKAIFDGEKLKTAVFTANEYATHALVLGALIAVSSVIFNSSSKVVTPTKKNSDFTPLSGEEDKNYRTTRLYGFYHAVAWYIAGLTGLLLLSACLFLEFYFAGFIPRTLTSLGALSLQILALCVAVFAILYTQSQVRLGGYTLRGSKYSSLQDALNAQEDTEEKSGEGLKAEMLERSERPARSSVETFLRGAVQPPSQ